MFSQNLKMLTVLSVFATFMKHCAATDEAPVEHFKISSSNSVNYVAWPMTPTEFYDAILSSNPILARSAAGIHWSAETDVDASKFDGINFVPSAEISSISWWNSNKAGQSQNGISVYHNFRIEINLKPSETMRDFKADLEVIYATEWALKTAMRTDIIIPEGTRFNYPYIGRTDVDMFRSNGQDMVQTGECFRTDKTVGECRCDLNGHVKDWEGKCILPDKSVISCEHSNDIGGPEEEGLLQCAPGYEIRVSKARLTREGDSICSAAKTDEKFSLKKYKTCVGSWVNTNKGSSYRGPANLPIDELNCDGKETCSYKFYNGDFPTGEKDYRFDCKGLSRYVTVTYGCSKLYDTPKPTDGPTDGDICESCAETGFTKERNCEYQGLEFSLEKTLSSYDDCLAWCDGTPMCVAFTFFDRIGGPNCFIKSGLLNKACNTGWDLTFSRKCNLAKECSANNEVCDVSRIPFFVAGSQEWNCSTNNGKKTCTMSCADGFQVGVTASCEDDVWSLESSVDTLSIWNAGCQTCSADPSSKYPIADDGTWNCDVSDGNDKVCVPTCPNNKSIGGTLVCERDESGYSEGHKGETDLYESDKNLNRTIRKYGALSCYVASCKKEDFTDVVTDYVAGKSWNVDVDEMSFSFDENAKSYKAYLECPSGKRSRTKCICKVTGKNQMKFKCAHLGNAKGC